MTVNVPKMQPKSLRDEIAIEAMRSLIIERVATCGPMENESLQQTATERQAATDAIVASTARVSYLFADAMIAERAKKPK